MVPGSIAQCMQEIAFFEEGEPMIDGEPGDLKVMFALTLLYQLLLQVSLQADAMATK